MTENTINNEDFCTGRRYGSTLELNTRKASHITSIKKIDKFNYCDLRTGELKKYHLNPSKSSISNLHNVKATMRKLRRLIAVNFDNQNLKKSALWLTLTYSDNMRDNDQLRVDLKAFFNKLFHFIHSKRKNLTWISVVEPQSRGSFHVHILIKFNNFNKVLFLPNKCVRNLWGHGFVNVQRISQTKNNALSRYLSTYLTDVLIDDNKGTEDSSIHSSSLFTERKVKHNKRVIKGARLYLYKKNMNIYRHSQYISREIVVVNSKKNILRFFNLDVKDLKSTFFKSFNIETSKGWNYKYCIEYLNVNT